MFDTAVVMTYTSSFDFKIRRNHKWTKKTLFTNCNILFSTKQISNFVRNQITFKSFYLSLCIKGTKKEELTFLKAGGRYQLVHYQFR